MPGADPVYGRLLYWDDPAGYRVEDGMASEDDLCNDDEHQNNGISQ